MNKRKVINIQEAEVIDFGQHRIIDDPLKELLEEFSHIEAEMEEDLIELHEHPTELLCSGLNDEEILSYFESRIELLEESRKRLKFYLDEIETHLLHK